LKPVPFITEHLHYMDFVIFQKLKIQLKNEKVNLLYFVDKRTNFSKEVEGSIHVVASRNNDNIVPAL
jgi:hypothetical protein